MIADEPIIIHVDPDSDIARHLESSGNRPVVIEHNGVRFEVTRERTRLDVVDHPRTTHNPERTRASMRAAAGSWGDIDAEAMKEHIYRGREEGNRPKDRPHPYDEL